MSGSTLGPCLLDPKRPELFPDLRRENLGELVAVGGDLSPQRILAAYRQGIFPWYGPGDPILWWSPDPRLLLFPNEIHISRRLMRLHRQARFGISLNLDFPAVIRQCATVKRKKETGTWILPEMIAAYSRLHQLGYAHSVEVWDREGRLCGGLYGLALGRAFFGESMFHLQSNCSRLALTALAEIIKTDFTFIDCQQVTPHLMRMGGRTVQRRRFLELLDQALLTTPPERDLWSARMITCPGQPSGITDPGQAK